MSAWKEAREFYKQKKAEEKLKKKLLSTKSDWHLLEQLIQKVNENPDLRIDIHLSDGTLINMKCCQKKETHDLINGNIYEVR